MLHNITSYFHACVRVRSLALCNKIIELYYVWVSLSDHVKMSAYLEPGILHGLTFHLVI